MADKYIYAQHVIYRAISNFVELGIKPKEIAEKMISEYRLEIRFFFVPKDKLDIYYEALAEQCWYDRYGNHNYY